MIKQMIDEARWQWIRRDNWVQDWQLSIARHLPRWLVYWATIVLFAHATTGRWGNEHPDSVRIGDALKRWDQSS